MINAETKIKEILLKQFSNVYCDTCGNSEEQCDYCHRKSMLWSLSQNTATELAEKIMGVINE